MSTKPPLLTDHAARPSAVPDGWKLVPVQPTDDMKKACDETRGPMTAWKAWQVMLAAAPQPPAPTNDDEAAQRYIRDWCPDSVKDYIERLKAGAALPAPPAQSDGAIYTRTAPKADIRESDAARVCAAAYVAAGACDWPVEWLDILSDAANDDPLRHDPLALLPFKGRSAPTAEDEPVAIWMAVHPREPNVKPEFFVPPWRDWKPVDTLVTWYDVRWIPLYDRPAPKADAAKAAEVMAAIASGEWQVSFTDLSGASYLTDFAKKQRAWSVERAKPPFCSATGASKWSAESAIEALRKGQAAMAEQGAG